MKLTLAEEIRALLEMEKKSYPMAYIGDSAAMWRAFPALAAKMLAVIAERDAHREALTRIANEIDPVDGMKGGPDAVETILQCIRSGMKASQAAPDFPAAAARIAELKEDAVRWETRYRFAMEQFTEERNYHIHTLKEMQATQKERDRLRFESECLQATVAK